MVTSLITIFFSEPLYPPIYIYIFTIYIYKYIYYIYICTYICTYILYIYYIYIYLPKHMSIPRKIYPKVMKNRKNHHGSRTRSDPKRGIATVKIPARLRQRQWPACAWSADRRSHPAAVRTATVPGEASGGWTQDVFWCWNIELFISICPLTHIGSMYGIYANMTGGILMVNVSIYSIHGSYG